MGVTFAELTALLAPTLGQEKSEEVVAEGARTLGVARDGFGQDTALALLDVLGKAPGMPGVAARFARARYARRPAAHPAEADEPATSPPPAPAKPPREGDPSAAAVVRGRLTARPAAPDKTIPRRRLTSLLAHTLGEERSDEVILAALRKRQLPEEHLGKRAALDVLEELAASPGVVGVTARFAKARAILLFNE